jgi:FkbM family methyltransferase
VALPAVELSIGQLDQALKLYLHDDRDQIVSRRIRAEGIWEPYESALILSLLQPGQVFVDVGANLGYFSVLAAAALGARGKVFAFEPDPDNFSLLQANLALNGLTERAEVACAGLSEQDSEGRLYLSEDNFGDHQIYAGDAERSSLPISLLCGEQWLSTRTDRIDLVKVDTQGSETAVMRGLLPLLKRLPGPRNILIELTPYSLVQAGSSGRQLIELLAELQQAFWIVDHVEHELVASSAKELALWCDNVQACEGDQGFMNILVGPGLAGA